LEVKEAAKLVRVSQLSLLEIQLLTFLRIKIVDLMFLTNFLANIFAILLRKRQQEGDKRTV